MRKHGGTPSRRDKHVTLAAISPPGVARGRFVGGQQSGLAGSKPPPLFTREASSCSSQGRRQGEPWGASPRPSAPTYLPTYEPLNKSLQANSGRLCVTQYVPCFGFKCCLQIQRLQVPIVGWNVGVGGVKQTRSTLRLLWKQHIKLSGGFP